MNPPIMILWMMYSCVVAALVAGLLCAWTDVYGRAISAPVRTRVRKKRVTRKEKER